MSTRQTAVMQQDFGAGMFKDAAPHLIPDTGLYDLVNGYLEEDGAAIKRGGTVYESTDGLGSAGLRWLSTGYFDVGERTIVANASDFGIQAADDSLDNLGSDGLTLPVPSAQLENMLFIGGGYIYGGSRKTADYTTSGGNTVLAASTTVTDASGGFTANIDAGMLMQNGNERVYVVASVDSDTSLTLREAYEGTPTATANVTFSKLYKITAADPYEDSEHYAVCANRLITASGNIVRFSTVPNPLTGAGRPHSFPATDYHELPDGVKVTGLAVSGLTLLIFTTGGIWTLQGLPFEIVDSNGNPQHRLSKLSSDQILWSAPGIATWDQAVIVPCVDGIYLIDGVSSPQRISHPIDDYYVRLVNSGLVCGQATVYRGHYLLPICSTAGTVRDFLVCRLNRPVKALGQTVHPWSRFDGHGGEVIALAVRVGDSARQPILLGASSNTDSRVLDCQRFFDPGTSYKQDADATTPVFDLTTREYLTGNNTENRVRSLRTRAQLVDAASDNPKLDFSYSLGRSNPGVPLWDQVNWNEFNWAVDSETSAFTDLDCAMSESDGLDPHKCRVGVFARGIRFRMRNDEPCAACIIRSAEVRVKPNYGVRR